MTNGDKIRAMSDEELVKFLSDFENEDVVNDYCKNGCKYRNLCKQSDRCVDSSGMNEFEWWIKKEAE